MIPFYYSDPHFGHKKIAEMRGFASTAEHDRTLIGAYQRTLLLYPAPTTVFWLGDCFFCPRSRAEEIMAQLPGEKILLRGNHDLGRSPDWYASLGFSLVLDGIITLPPIADRPVRACHLPYAGTPYGEGRVDDRYTALRPVKRHGEILIHGESVLTEEVLLHGHSHSKVRLRGLQVHVGVDAWNLGPVSRRQIEYLLKGAEA